MAKDVNCNIKEVKDRITSWKQKVYKYKDRNKEKQKYCFHEIQIGNDKYTFTERKFPAHGVIINPDYKISDEVPDVGGVPKQYGELMFWDYYFEDSGWKRVRAITNNELICLDIIKKYGFFATEKEEPKAKRKGLFKK